MNNRTVFPPPPEPEGHDPMIPLVAFGNLASAPLFPGMDGLLCTLLHCSGATFQDALYMLEEKGVMLPDCGLRIAKYTLEEGALAHVEPQGRHVSTFSLYYQLRERLIAKMTSGGGYAAMLLGCLVVFWFAGDEDRTLELASESVLRELGYPCMAVVSSYVPTLSDMSRTYTTMNQLESGRRFYGADTPVITMSFGGLNQPGPQSQNQSQEVTASRICGALIAGDIAAATERLRNALASIAAACRGQPYPSALSFATLRFVDDLQYSMSENGILDLKFLRAQDFARLFLTATNVSEYVAMADHAIGLIKAEMDRRQQQEQARVMEQVSDYIRCNAMTPDICVGSVAQHFGMSSRDIASKFAEYYGYGIRDLIHRCRVDAAKELILTTDEPISTIAEKVGYYSLVTMHRAFINNEGISPGKFRERK